MPPCQIFKIFNNLFILLFWNFQPFPLLQFERFLNKNIFNLTFPFDRRQHCRTKNLLKNLRFCYRNISVCYCFIFFNSQSRSKTLLPEHVEYYDEIYFQKPISNLFKKHELSFSSKHKKCYLWLWFLKFSKKNINAVNRKLQESFSNLV